MKKLGKKHKVKKNKGIVIQEYNLDPISWHCCEGCNYVEEYPEDNLTSLEEIVYSDEFLEFCQEQKDDFGSVSVEVCDVLSASEYEIDFKSKKNNGFKKFIDECLGQTNEHTKWCFSHGQIIQVSFEHCKK